MPALTCALTDAICASTMSSSFPAPSIARMMESFEVCLDVPALPCQAQWRAFPQAFPSASASRFSTGWGMRKRLRPWPAHAQWPKPFRSRPVRRFWFISVSSLKSTKSSSMAYAPKNGLTTGVSPFDALYLGKRLLLGHAAVLHEILKSWSEVQPTSACALVRSLCSSVGCCPQSRSRASPRRGWPRSRRVVGPPWMLSTSWLRTA